MQSVGATFAASGLQIAWQSPRLQRIQPVQYVELRCPVCTAKLTVMPYDLLGRAQEPVECRRCFTMIVEEQGIWVALPQDRQRYFERFMRDYEAVRKAEGRGSDNANFYLSLPYCEQTDRNSWQWAIRARTYKYIEKKILSSITARINRPLAILDLGAGNGWVSYRLASLGHRPIAVDLQTNAFDGLGAAVHYQHALPMLFPRFQAELDQLPFGSGQFDLAIFNASFHYSENYHRTLAEAVRCLRPGGTVLIADSPFYSREECGQRMVEERRKVFQERFACASDSLANCEYLTNETLLALEARHDLEWKTHEVWYGIRWACRPVVAFLKNQREPSKFRIYTAKVKTV
jgi:SAM-dependent methyltransferase